MSFIRDIYYKFKYRGRDIIIRRGAHIRGGSELEGMNCVSQRTVFRGRLGRCSYIGADGRLTADVGRYTSIGPRVISNPGIHTYRPPFVSTSPMFFNRAFQRGKSYATRDTIDNNRYAVPERRLDVKIGNDCWICEDVFLCGGVTVGDGAVVMAGAVVTHDVEPYSIVGGVPAKLMGYRFDKGNREFLQKLKWWNLPDEWLRENWELFNDINRLKAAAPQVPLD